MPEVRLYRPEDAPSLCEICCETALLGDPLPECAGDRQALANLLILPYLKLQPNAVWVCQDDGRVVGYLTGVLSPSFSRRTIPCRAAGFLRLAWDYLRGRNDGHLAKWLLLRSWREEPSVPEGAYAHFHFNLLNDYRSKGFGGECVERFEEQARARGLDQISAKAFCREGFDDEGIWYALGFEAFDRHPTTFLTPYLTTPLDWVTFVKRL